MEAQIETTMRKAFHDLLDKPGLLALDFVAFFVRAPPP
jgi:hypothetical protein